MLARSRDPGWCDARKVAEMIELTLDMAERAARAAREKARALGTPITVTVVDEAGPAGVCARGDGTAVFTPETPRAETPAAAHFPTSAAPPAERAHQAVPV